MAGKTNAERQAAYRQRQAEQEATEVRGIFAHKDDHAAIKAYAEKLAKKRAKAANAEITGLSTRPPGYRAGTNEGEK